MRVLFSEISSSLTRRLGRTLATGTLVISSGAVLGAVVAPNVAGADANVGRNPVAVAVDDATGIAYIANEADGTITIDNGTPSYVLPAITLNDNPVSIAVDPTTDMLYTANESNTVSVVDASTKSLVTSITLPNVDYSSRVVVNPTTDTIYVAATQTISQKVVPVVVVINGATNTVTTSVSLPSTQAAYNSLAVNPSTNTVYAGYAASASNQQQAGVSEINGATNSITANINLSGTPTSLVVNPTTNTIFAGESYGAVVAEINGATNQVTTGIVVPYGIVAMDVDTSSGLLYVLGSLTLTYVNPATPEMTHVTPLVANSNPTDLAVDTATHQIFMTNALMYQNARNTTGTVTVLDDTIVQGFASIAAGLGPSQVAFNATTNTAYVVNAIDGTLSVINLTTNTDSATITLGQYPGDVAVNTATNTVYVTVGDNLDIINGANNTLAYTVPIGSGAGALAVNPTTNMVYVGVSSPGGIDVVNGATRAVTSISGSVSPAAMTVNASTNTLYATNGTAETVSVINGATNTVTQTIAIGEIGDSIVLNAATSTLVVGDESGTNMINSHLSVISTATNTLTNTIVIEDRPYSVFFGTSNATVYAVGPSSIVSVNLTTGTATAPDLFPSDGGYGFFDATTGTVDVTLYGGSSTSAGIGPNGLGLFSPLPTPVISSTTPGNTFVNVSVAPAADGGLPVDTYTVTATDLTTPANGGQVVSSATSPITMTGLTNGDQYTFTVTATNDIGTTAASAASAITVPATLPGAPTNVTATPGNQQAVVSFSAPASNGGSPITSYSVKVTDASIPLRGGQVVTGTTSPITITGLYGGDNYTFTVTATNAVGTGAASAASSSVFVVGPPSAPFSVTASPGNQQAWVYFQAPQYDNGEPVTGYTVTAVDSATPANGGQTATGTSSPIIVTGLTNGDNYTFTVTASNIEGASVASAASSAVSPKYSPSAPPAPTNVTVVPKDCGATVSFTPPSTDNGSPITNYRVYVTDLTNAANGGQQPSGPSSPISFCGLTDGDEYTVTVAAQNEYGTGPKSAPSAVFVPMAPVTVPGQPTGAGATGENNSAIVTFYAPLSDGNATITSYTVTATDLTTPANGGQTASGPSSPITVTGLTNGDEYTFTVVATNSAGASVASGASNSVVVGPPPGKAPPPTNIVVTPKDCGATVSFSPPSTDNGSAINHYDIYLTDLTNAANGGQEEITSSSPFSFCGLTDGDQYTLAIASVNSYGEGTLSAPSAVFVPSVVVVAPNAPVGVTATPLNKSALVYFTAPIVDGGAVITSYTITAHDLTNAANGGETVSGGSSPLTIMGLTNGDTYDFTVTAMNSAGTGPASAASLTVIPSTQSVPDAPTNVVATAGVGSATVTWTPGFDEGSAIENFVINSSGGQQCTYDVGVSPGVDTCTFTNLPAGTYTFVVREQNGKGSSLNSAPSAAITVVALPGAPTGVTVVPGYGQATITWSAPSSTGGSAITSYTVTSTPGSQTCTYTVGVSVGTRTCTITGLTNGTKYTFKVTATTAVGTGAASTASSSVTPLATDAHITSAASFVVTPGGKFTLALTATGPAVTSSSAARFSELGAPSFAKLTAGHGTSANTASLAGTAPTTAGVYTFDLIVSSPTGTKSVQTVTLTVLGFISAASATFTVGTAGSMVITTNDSHASVSTTSKLPTGVTLVNHHNGTATLSGTPTSKTGSPFTVTITASDGTATTTQTFHLTVN